MSADKLGWHEMTQGADPILSSSSDPLIKIIVSLCMIYVWNFWS